MHFGKMLGTAFTTRFNIVDQTNFPFGRVCVFYSKFVFIPADNFNKDSFITMLMQLHLRSYICLLQKYFRCHDMVHVCKNKCKNKIYLLATPKN